MTKVKIPFLKEFKDVMLSGKKRMTSRTKKYGEVADVFDAFGSSFLILAVKKMDLRDISCFYYKDEGFDNQEEFTECWKKIHPRKGFVPTQMVWVHRFRKLNVGEELSLQKKLELRRQREMAQRSNKQWHDGYCKAIDDTQKAVRSCASSVEKKAEKLRSFTKTGDSTSIQAYADGYKSGVSQLEKIIIELLVGSSPMDGSSKVSQGHDTPKEGSSKSASAEIEE